MSINEANGKTLRTFRTNSQCSKILEYLKHGNSLTVERARELKFGANLRSRISNLEDAGYKIKREYVKVNGGTYVALYSLADEHLYVNALVERGA